jgi:hypothetical protein
MKNRVLRVLLFGAALGALVMGVTPAQAASLAWEDPKDDAADPLEEHAAFDITAVKVSNDGGVVKFEMDVPGMVEGAPTGATGYTFRFEFMYGEGEFRLQVNEHILGETTANLGMYGDVTTILPCEKCEGKIDRATKKVFISAPVADIDKGLQSTGAPPLAGQEWTTLIGVALRPITLPVTGTPSDGLRFVVDEAPAEDLTLKF